MVWAFNKFEGQNLPEIGFFPFSDWKMNLSEYIFSICLTVVPMAFVWTLVSQEIDRPKEIKLIAWIVSFKLLWFLLTCNMTFFRITVNDMGVIPIGYDAVALFLIGLVVLKATIYEQRL